MIFFFEISKIQDYIAQSNKGKIKKEKEAQIKELKERLKKLEAQIKKSKNKIKELKMKKIKNSTTTPITNNFGKITKN